MCPQSKRQVISVLCLPLLLSVFPLQPLNDQKHRWEGEVASSHEFISLCNPTEIIWGRKDVAVTGQWPRPVMCVLKIKQLPGMTVPKSQMRTYS